MDFNEKGNIIESDFLITFLATESENKKKKKVTKQRTKKTDIQKRANLPNKIFNYIYMVPCCRLFLLARHDDMTHIVNITGIAKALPIPYCNGPNYSSPIPDYL